MNKNDAALNELFEEWSAATPDKTQNGIRKFLEGERPVDAGTSKTHKVSNKSALLIFNYDSEALRYKLQREFAKSVIFDGTEIKYLKETYGLNDFQAEAAYCINLLLLRNEFVKNGVKVYGEFITSTLSGAFKTIEKDSYTDSLNKFRRASKKTKNMFVEEIGLSYIERLKQNAYRFLKAPKVGRPTDTEDKSEKIKLAVKQLLEESFGSIKKSNINEILNGKIVPPRITKIKVALQLKISRPQFNKWLNAAKLDFEELVNSAQSEFYQSLRNQMNK